MRSREKEDTSGETVLLSLLLLVCAWPMLVFSLCVCLRVLWPRLQARERERDLALTCTNFVFSSQVCCLDTKNVNALPQDCRTNEASWFRSDSFGTGPRTCLTRCSKHPRHQGWEKYHSHPLLQFASSNPEGVPFKDMALSKLVTLYIYIYIYTVYGHIYTFVYQPWKWTWHLPL